MFKSKNLFFIVLLAICFSVASCYNPPVEPAGCTYDIEASTDIAGVTVFYPCTMSGTYKTVTLSGGFTNVKEDMYWLANYLVKNNVIVFAVSAESNTSTLNYEKTHKACFNLIKSENAKSTSKIYGKVGKIGLIGYSMGGGGVLDAAQDMGSQIDTVIGLAPYNPETELSGVKASVYMLVGSSDIVAPPSSHAEPAYDDLPNIITKGLGLIGESFSHLDFVDDNPEQQDPVKTMVLAWLQYVLDGSQTAKTSLLNPPSPITYYNKNF
jgi:hypothetical protein